MTPNRVLLDSSFLFSLYNPEAKHYQESLSFFEEDKSLRILPEAALAEVAYLLWLRAKPKNVEKFLFALAKSEFQFVSLIPEDFERIRIIRALYQSANFDFVDCCLMALSERLNITRICTYDRRDFAIFRPKHCDYLDLEP